MDDRTKDSMRKWEALSAAGIEYARPWLDLTPEVARRRIDPEGQLSQISGRRVLCLAASGGQQSAAFGLLGARVVVLDFSRAQLAKDRATAQHYGIEIETLHGDIQDLSRFRDGEFDIVWFAHSLNFVPDARGVIAQIGRVCKKGGLLRMTFTNPYVHGVWDSYREGGYLLSQRYADGAVVHSDDPFWSFTGDDGRVHRIEGPTEFRHRLSTIINGLVGARFEILGFWEEVGTEEAAAPGSWQHFTTVAPPWLIIWGKRGGDGSSGA